MTLRERFEKLEPRERRLLTIMLAMLGAVVLLAGPIFAYSSVSSLRDENEQIRYLVQQTYGARATVSERKAKRDAILARYAKPAPQLAGFIEEAAKSNGIQVPESQDKPDVPHGKRYTEKLTVVKMHKIGLTSLVKTLEKIEQSGHPVAISRLSIRPRAGEPDSYEVELGVSAFERKPDAKETAAKDKGDAKADEGEEEKAP
ncbi:type II secretion system protein M [Polyangium aurulentum]|uniref:type II secretion system protein M n=1 Tax=Polyangium aurulentum TaxID=2567896 RepID=UPI0010AE3B56|nr:type II secretion system protein M [Polyangium aurulentum]UQA60819.1 type II secretion system protein M [Polyangium aurulentum]